jgi:ABC-type multidrug transport system fused ATPase/permease subunit
MHNSRIYNSGNRLHSLTCILNQGDTMTPFKFGMKYYKRNIPAAVFSQLISFTATIADLLLPLLLEMFIDYVICENTVDGTSLFSFILSNTGYPVHSPELFRHLAFFYAGLLLIRIVLVYAKNVLNQNLGLNLETDLRYAAYKKLMQLDSQTISEFNTGELLQTINSDTIMYKELFSHMIPGIIDGIFAMCISVIVLAKINVWLLILPVLLSPVFVYELRKFKKTARENYLNIRANNSRMNLTVQENIEAVRLVRAFTNESLEEEKFDKTNTSLKNAHLAQIGLSAKFEAVFSTIKQTAYIGTIAVSTLLVFKGFLKVGYLVACASYVMKIMNYVTQINSLFFMMQQQMVAGVKMMNFMNCEPKVPDTGLADIDAEDNRRPHIKFDSASLELGGKKILSNISIDIPYGKKIGITGSTGSGKSMLLESLVRNYELTSGRISLGGKDIRSYPLRELREKFAYVFQESFLFSNTITSNIRYAEERPDTTADDAEMKKAEQELIINAAKHAQAHNFISNLPEGYNTIVGERGIGLSGGQKQRLSIARALMKNSPVLIFDDSTSALDVETEKKLLSDIKQYYPEKTILISAHRMSSVKDCDEIIYMENGTIAEHGSFKELMKLNGHFAAVYNIQEAQQQTIVDYDALAVKKAGV